MAELIYVKPAHPGAKLYHFAVGDLSDEGGLWPADQFTFRRLNDGDVVRASPPAAPVPAPSPAPAPAPEPAPEPAPKPADEKAEMHTAEPETPPTAG